MSRVTWRYVYWLVVLLDYQKSLVPVSKLVGVEIDLERAIHITDERYLSIAQSAAVIRRHELVDFISTRVQTMASGLAPCYLRVGGTNGNFLIFQPDAIDSRRLKERDNSTMTGADWDKLNTFAKSIGGRLLFGFNFLLRNGEDWDDSNARQILKYSIQKGYDDNLDFQLGNEPNALRKTVNRSLSATQLGHDYRHLHSLLHEVYKDSEVMRTDITNPIGNSPFKKSLLIGPDITRPKELDDVGLDREVRVESAGYLEEFLSAADHVIDAVSWHQYYFNGDVAQLSSFLNASIMDVLTNQIADIRKVMQKTGYGDTKMWLSETSSASGGGAPGLTDRYVAGFLWLDKLGTAARGGTDVVVRQSLYGANYSLIDKQLTPLPDYWLSLLYKILVGNKVLDVTTDDESHRLRVYAHCTNTMRSEHPAGSVTVYALNVHNETVTAELPPTLQSGIKLEYLLTPHGPDGLQSKIVALNGEPLDLIDDHTLPQLLPMTLKPSAPLTLPSNTFGFWVFPEAEAAVCA